MAESRVSDSGGAAEALAQWSKSEMKFPTAHQVEVKKLASFLAPACKGSAMVALWNKVTNQVKSKAQAEHIRKNIKLSELATVGERLASSLDEKSRALKVVEKDIESLQLQLKRHKEDLQESKLRLMNAEQSNQLLEMKSCMYQNHQRYLQTKNEGLKSFSRWILEICMAYQQRPGETECDKLKIECEKHVKNVCRLIGEKHSPQSYASIGELVKYYHPKLIISSLMKQCEHEIVSIKGEEERVDFLNDMKKLESQYVNEEILGQTGMTNLATVQTMLHQRDLDVVNGFTESQICKQNAENMLLQIEQERNQIASQLEVQYEFEPSNLQLAIDLLDAEVELATVHGSIRSFQSSVARLQQDIHQKTQARDQLFAVKAKIDGFSDTLAENQRRIIEITKHNAAIKSKVNERQAQILGVPRVQICEKYPEVTKICTDLKCGLMDRLTAFSHVSLGKIWRADIEPDITSQVQQLSIYKYLNLSQENEKMSHQKVAQGLNIHSHVAVSTIFQRAVDAKKEISQDKLMKNVSVNTTLSDNKLQTVLDLTEEGTKVEKRQIETIKTKYKSGVNILESASKQCQALEQMIEIWYEQPAQYQTPWLTAEGRSLKDWKNKIENLPSQTT